jgi:hypothetical protein
VRVLGRVKQHFCSFPLGRTTWVLEELWDWVINPVSIKVFSLIKSCEAPLSTNAYRNPLYRLCQYDQPLTVI